MIVPLLLVCILVCSQLAYWLGARRASRKAGAGGLSSLHSRPQYYGMLTALWCGLPALLVVLVWFFFAEAFLTSTVMEKIAPSLNLATPEEISLAENDLKNMVAGHGIMAAANPFLQQAAEDYLRLKAIGEKALFVVLLCLMTATSFFLWRRISPEMRARNHVELIIRAFLILCSTLAVFTTLGIVLSVLFESIRFFQLVPITDFLFGLKWSPQMAIRADQVGSSGSFGAVPVFAGTMLISFIAMLVAAPVGLMSAIYLAEYAGKKFRAVAKPLLEILAGVPTVVYGFFAALTVAPAIRSMGTGLGLSVSSESALAAGLVMGVMIIPFVLSISDDVINAVPQALRDGSYGLGATRSETIRLVVIPAALPGIVGGMLLAVSRAIGETMIVVMAAGLSANLTANPLQAVTTVTVQIVTLLVGDQEFDSPKTLAAFALGLLLFVVTLALNIVALYVVRKYREQYE
ncbi:MAG: phosphate ABC transporter permease subunit PstC [Desulfobulbus sp.]|jgi:phosphate transport system permease protein|nr:MAG: phosphate ABC transporter permease subunit PstC [Desulfobulbus sp.]